MGDGDHGHIHPCSFFEREAVLVVHGHITPPSSGKGRGADYAHRPDGFFGNNEWVVEAMAIYNLPILGGEGAVVILVIYHVPSLVNGRGVDHAHTCSFLF